MRLTLESFVIPSERSVVAAVEGPHTRQIPGACHRERSEGYALCFFALILSGGEYADTTKGNAGVVAAPPSPPASRAGIRKPAFQSLRET